MRKARYFLKRFIYSTVYKWHMGLDELVRKAAARGSGWFNKEFLNETFPECKDKWIDSRTGYWFAINSNKKTCDISLEILNPQDSPFVEEALAVSQLNNLVYVIREIYNTSRNQESFARLLNACAVNKLKNIDLSEEDRALILPFFDILGDSSAREIFYAGLKERESRVYNLGLRFDTQSDLVKEIRKLNKGYVNFNNYVDGVQYVSVLIQTLESMKVRDAGRQLDVTDKALRTLKSRLEDELRGSCAHSQKNLDVSVFYKLDKLCAARNFPKIAIDAGVDCCITQPDGKSKEATVLYAIDKTVTVWSFSFKGGSVYYDTSFALAIFVKARGHHFSKTVPENYLVLEGFPANQRYYSRVGKMDAKFVCSDIENYALGRLGRSEVSFTELVYILGLKTAKREGISKLFVNTEHSDRQKSVHDAIRTAAIECSLSRGEVWDMGSHGSFKLLKDQHTEKDFQVFKDPGTNEVLLYDKNRNGKREPFEYTHFLQKRALPAQLVKMIRKNPLWKGENVFDTWYGWNRFIMDTHKQWSDELKAKHPYAKAIYERGRDPQWNLGIGYCKGFEVDVEKECKRLGIS